MPKVPERPKIYHITHVRNLPRIIKAGMLWSDRKRLELNLACRVVGMDRIKRRRLEQIEVAPCHPGTRVGDYVPFYLCPRSVMLFLLHKGNHPDLDYSEGQEPILHLQADLYAVVEWAKQNGRRWAFTDGNAGAYYCSFYADLESLSEINWRAVAATDFSKPEVKERKQAEFLIHESFPWSLVEEIGVHDERMRIIVDDTLTGTTGRPLVRVEPEWYY